MVHPTTTLQLVDGVRIVVPDSLDLITPYVLREQEDWFEDELRFVRKLLQPGQTVIDVGASYGVYTLSMAAAVGAGGSVLAFELASATARLLTESIAANGFTQVTLRQQALSSASGTGQLVVGEQSELNALVRGAASGPVEAVPLVTLDDCLRDYGWTQVDFVKIDAEGEERNILQGGERFFSELSPLVQYEVKAGTELHLDLVEAFKERGYASYRLVPGLDLLVPFDAAEPDDYLLNLFCCKRDQAERLAARGRLLIGDEKPEVRPDDWRRAMGAFPYARQLRDRWQRTMAAGQSDDLDRALSLYWRSRDASSPAAERYEALSASVQQLGALCDRGPANLRLASLARAARDHGSRKLAVGALERLTEAVWQSRQIDAAEPFLLPADRFDEIAPRNPPGDWLLAATLEAYERLSDYSSFYTEAAALPRLEAIRNLGYGSPEMQRRLAMTNLRFRNPG